jgi:transposase
MIEMVRRHQIQVVRRTGRSLVETAAQAGVSARSVRRVAAEAPVADFDDSAERKRRRIGRPSKADPFRAYVAQQLISEPDVLTLELLRRARAQGYAGGKSALYALARELRPEPVRPVVRFEGLPGEFSQHDFGQVDVRYLDGRVERVHFFASRLKYSRWVQVAIVRDERVESLVRALVDHYAAWGGVPLPSVFDRPKTVATSWTKDRVEWNPIFGAVVLELGATVELCAPRRPEQKGSVENLVGWVKGSFFKQRRFVDREDLQHQLDAWHVEVNTQRPSRATKVTPAARMLDERPRLRPLRVTPDQLALRIPLVVDSTGHVVHDTHRYSMPTRSIGLAATLWLCRDRVKIVAGRYAAEHPRKFVPGETSMLSEHRTDRVQAARGKRGKLYTQREHLLALGESAVVYLTELVFRREHTWPHDVDELHALLDTHGESALRAAFAHCLALRVFGHEYIAHHLTNPIAALGVQQELFA